MNQSKPVQRTFVSFFIAMSLVLLCIGIQNSTAEEDKQNLEASVYPKEFSLQEK